MNNKGNFKKTLIWLLAAYPIGLLVGIVLISVFLIPVFPLLFSTNSQISELISPFIPLTYIMGFIYSILLFILLIPFFLIFGNILLKLEKRYNLTTQWLWTILFALLIGVISVLALYLIVKYSNNHPRFAPERYPIVPIIGFFSGWVGALLPRLIIKRLRPKT